MAIGSSKENHGLVLQGCHAGRQFGGSVNVKVQFYITISLHISDSLEAAAPLSNARHLSTYCRFRDPLS